MLSFEDVGMGDWEKFSEQILHSEGVFPECIRTPREDFLEVVSEGDGVAKVALLDSSYVGNVFGYRIPDDDYEYYGLHDVPQGAKVIYLFSIVINPEFQGRGYGRQLIWEFIKTAKDRGYDFVAGHFRQNGSLKLIKRFGAKEECVCQNWENMGEDYVACCLDLKCVSNDFNGLLPSDKLPLEEARKEAREPMPIMPEMDETLFRTGPGMEGPVTPSPHF
jgi:GNAT superfamily N-acetyltransferase